MKRTTYIMIGAFVAGWLILVGDMLWTVSLKKAQSESDISFNGKQISQDLPPFKVVTFSQVDKYKQEYWKGITANIQITSSTNKENVFSYPEEMSSFLEARVEADTLKIDFNFPKANVEEDKDKHKHYRDFRVMAGDWKLVMAQPVDKIESRIMGLDMNLRKVSQDSLNIMMGQRAYSYVDSCCITSLKLGATRNVGDFFIKNSEIKNLYINLNEMWRWDIDSSTCKIDTEYLTGNKSANVTLQKGECRRMIWIPENENSTLEVMLTEKACVTIQK